MTEQPNLDLQPNAQPPAEKSQSECYLDAIRKGADEAIAAHGAAGRKIPVSRDGSVVWVSADELLQESRSQGAGS